MPPIRKPARPIPPEVTIARMRDIVLMNCRYGIRGVAAVDVIAPHCAVALFLLTRGAMTVHINGERSGFKWALALDEGHRDFAATRGELREAGPVKLRHLHEHDDEA